jgi:hypothetical protein
VVYRVFNFLLAGTSALIAHRQLEPMLRSTEGEISRAPRRRAAVAEALVKPSGVARQRRPAPRRDQDPVS